MLPVNGFGKISTLTQSIRYSVCGRTAKGETQIAYIFRKHKAHGYDDIQIAGATLMGQTLNATLGEYGFLLNDKERKLMAGLLIDLLKETENTLSGCRPPTV